jgi:diguanylate cyclase (GGDEF)-like protein
LILTDDPELYERLARDVGNEVPLVWARSLEEAMSHFALRSFALAIVDANLYEGASRPSIARVGTVLGDCPIVLLAAEAWLSNSRELTTAVGTISREWDRSELQRLLARGLLVGTMRLADEGGKRCRILVVDDSPEEALLVADALADGPGHFDVDACERLSDAITQLALQEYGAIVTELSLSDARGLDTVVQLQAAAPNVPVIVHTSVDDEVIVACAARLGAQNYLVKGDATPAAIVRAIRSGIERKARERELWNQARHDSLTGLPNRVALETRFRAAIQLAELRGEPLTVLVVDLDGFKAVNDTMGHEQGDEVLIRVSRKLRDTLRDTDFVARFGGDEFVVLAPSARHPEGLAERLRRALETPVTDENRSILVTASVGHATYPSDGRSTDELLTVADRNMYTVKRSRISQVVRRPSSAPDSVSDKSR